MSSAPLPILDGVRLSERERLTAYLMARIAKDAETGCWRWIGSRHAGGYGDFKCKPLRCVAHRAAWMLLVGPIPEGLTLDHVKARGCVYRDCVNPEHLEPVSLAVNVLRGDGPPALNARKETCSEGHPFDKIEPHSSGGTKRVCMTCRRKYMREYARMLRARQAA